MQKKISGKGVAKASLRKISAEANMTTGAVYFFFKDKNGLFGAAVDREAFGLLFVTPEQ